MSTSTEPQSLAETTGAEFARQVGMLPPRDSALDRGMLTAFNASTRMKRRLKR